MTHLTRYMMYNQIKEAVYPIKGKILGISGINNFYPFIDREKSEITEVEYPKVNLHNLPFGDLTFDFIITDQVLEHIQDPKKAISESYRVLNNGGVAIHTTCFMNYIHYCPTDFWRFSPDALRLISEGCGFSKIIQCAGWGNRTAVILCLLGNRFRSISIPDNRWSLRHYIATKNDLKYPIVTWLVARK
jgi:SAM-dependent methyltransferase